MTTQFPIEHKMKVFSRISRGKLGGFGWNLAKGCGVEKEWPYKIHGKITPGTLEKMAKNYRVWGN